MSTLAEASLIVGLALSPVTQDYKDEPVGIIEEYKNPLGSDCVRYARSRAEFPLGMWDLEDKMEIIRKKEPEIGSVGITSEGGYGHMVIVEKIEQDSLVVSEGNYHHGFVTVRRIEKNKILGYY